MKKLITLIVLLLNIAAYGQGVNTLEVKKVEAQSSVDSDTRLMVWDSTNFGKVKYTKIGNLPIGNDGVVQSVSLLGNLLNFSGTNGAFSGAVDLSSLAGGSDDLGNHTATQNLNLDGNDIISGSDNVFVIELTDIQIGDSSGNLNKGLRLYADGKNVADYDVFGTQQYTNGNYTVNIDDDNNDGNAFFRIENTTETLFQVNEDGTVDFSAFSIPATSGTNGQVLTSNGAGGTSWADASGASNQTFDEVVTEGNTANQDVIINGFRNGLTVQDTVANDRVIIESTNVSVQDQNTGTVVQLNKDGTISFNNGTASSQLRANLATVGRTYDLQDKSGTIAHLDDIPSSQLSYVTVTDSTYTMLEADILSSKTYLINAYRVDGITPVDTVTVTYPTITHDGSLLVSSFANISGSSIKVVPDTDVVDYRTGTKKQYTTKPELQGYVSISSVAQDSIWGSSNDWTIGDYTAPSAPFDSGFIINGTFDDASNITTEGASWTIANGVASYDGVATQWLDPELSQNLTATPHTLTLDISNTTGSGVRFEVKFFNVGGSLDQKTGYVYYVNGTHTINFTPNAPVEFIQIDFSNSGEAGDLDNLSITLD